MPERCPWNGSSDPSFCSSPPRPPAVSSATPSVPMQPSCPDVCREERADGGALTLSYVVIMPVFLAAILVIVQASMWYLARETAIAAARQGADVARTANPPPGRGVHAAVVFARQAAPGFLLAPT